MTYTLNGDHSSLPTPQSWLSWSPVASVEHIGPEPPTHRDIFAAAHFLTRAVQIIPDKIIRNSSQRLAERISQLRLGAEADLRPTITQLQQDEDFRMQWVRTGMKQQKGDTAQ
jgi:hypothetical protein